MVSIKNGFKNNSYSDTMQSQKSRIKSLSRLKSHIKNRHPLLEANIHRTSFHNPWFEKSHYWKSLDALADHMLLPDRMAKWCKTYQFPLEQDHQKTIGLIFAGNIPLVGFHDFLMVYLSGHKAEVKLSGKDPYVFPAILDLIGKYSPKIKDRIRLVEKLRNHEAVIATGSNNTNRYFKKYFGNYPSILRNNRTSVAVLDGHESKNDLELLALDVFDYFGLGCRNVTKLYVPNGYHFDPFLDAIKPFNRFMNNSKYKNNYDYNLSIELLNRTEMTVTDFVLLKKEPSSLFSPIGMIFFEEYSDIDEIVTKLKNETENLQTVVGRYPVEGVSRTDFGKSQQPDIFDYPDGEDIGHFLFELSCK